MYCQKNLEKQVKQQNFCFLYVYIPILLLKPFHFSSFLGTFTRALYEFQVRASCNFVSMKYAYNQQSSSTLLGVIFTTFCIGFLMYVFWQLDFSSYAFTMMNKNHFQSWLASL